MEHFVCAIWYSLYVLCSSSQQSKAGPAREILGMATESLSILTLGSIFPLFHPLSPPLPLTTHIFLVFSYQAIALLLLILKILSNLSVSPPFYQHRHCQNYCNEMHFTCSQGIHSVTDRLRRIHS